MTDRWQRVEELCQSALELAESQRRASLEEACAGAEGLRREVESLLKFDKPGDQFIKTAGNKATFRLAVCGKETGQRPLGRYRHRQM